MFNILGQDLSGFEVLELYAGTGALGFEALSRNARRVVFVEASPKLAAGIRGTAETLGVDREARVVVGRVEDVLDRRQLGGPFELIVADPPYAATDTSNLIARIDEARLLGLHGKLVIERETRTSPATGTAGLTLRRTTSYGRASLDFYNY
jgi:16S rRNA (guanine966-N2)-methyltransferase